MTIYYAMSGASINGETISVLPETCFDRRLSALVTLNTYISNGARLYLGGGASFERLLLNLEMFKLDDNI